MKLFSLLLIPAALFAGEARYARLGDIDGQVEVQLTAADPWMPAERNLVLPESAWARTGPSSRLEIELDDGSAWRLGPDSQGEISDYSRLSTGQRITLLSLDHGVAYYTGEPLGRDVMMLVVPGAQVTLTRGARVRVMAQTGFSQISVIEGTVRFSSPAAELDLREGQTTRVEPANPSRFFLEPTVSAMTLDKWSEDRDKIEAAPASASHVVEHYGVADLDTAGQWIQTDDLGAVWKPKVDDGWAPFQNGRWRWYEALGYTWVSADSWGWLPYHYGRWALKKDVGWVWAPTVRAVFKPGDVYWLRGQKLAGWGPLAPGEQWMPPNGTAGGPPLQYAALNTTYAAFLQDAQTIDPSGFTARPTDPLQVAVWALALPSPAFLASRLEATRPMLRVGSTRITPTVPSVTFQDTTAEMRPPGADQLPVVIVSDAPPDYSQPGPPVIAPPPDGIYPPTVVNDVVIVNPPLHPDYAPPRYPSSGKPAAPAPAAPTQTTPAAPPSAGRPTHGAPDGQPHDPPPVTRPAPQQPAQAERPRGDLPPERRDSGSTAPARVAPSSTPSQPTPSQQAAPAPAGIPHVEPPPNRPQPSVAVPHIEPPTPKVDKPADKPADATPAKKSNGAALRDPGEYNLYTQVMQHLYANNPSRAVESLNTWTQKFAESSYKDDRIYLYMQAYSRLSPPRSDKVVDFGAQLMAKDLRATFADPAQILQVLHMVTVHAASLSGASPKQLAAGNRAARELLTFTPEFFAPEKKPAGFTDVTWAQAREQVETAARNTIAALAKQPHQVATANTH